MANTLMFEVGIKKAQGEYDKIYQEVMELAQMAMQALQGQDCEAAMAVCEGYVQLIQEMAGGGEAGAAAPQQEPVYRAGGKLVGHMN